MYMVFLGRGRRGEDGCVCVGAGAVVSPALSPSFLIAIKKETGCFKYINLF